MTEICLRRCFFVEITICIGSSCHLHGSRDVIQVLEKLVTAHGLTAVSYTHLTLPTNSLV